MRLFFAAERVRLITSTINWRFSHQRFYALLHIYIYTYSMFVCCPHRVFLPLVFFCSIISETFVQRCRGRLRKFAWKCVCMLRGMHKWRRFQIVTFYQGEHAKDCRSSKMHFQIEIKMWTGNGLEFCAVDLHGHLVGQV